MIAIMLGWCAIQTQAYAAKLTVEEKPHHTFIRIETNNPKDFQVSLNGHWLMIPLTDELFYQLEEASFNTKMFKELIRAPNPRYGILRLTSNHFYEIARKVGKENIEIRITDKTAQFDVAFKQLSTVPIPQLRPALDANDLASFVSTQDVVSDSYNALRNSIDFPWFRNIGAASFERAGIIWFVFDEWKAIDTHYFYLHYPELITMVEQLPHPSKTIIRMKFSKEFSYEMTREDVTWRLNIYDKDYHKEPKFTAKQVSSSYGKEITFDAEQASEPIRMKDPLIGDDLIIIPFLLENSGHPKQRHFVDFTIHPSYQGMVVLPHASGVEVSQFKNRIEITAPSYMNVKHVTVPVMKQIEGYSLLYPFVTWRGNEANMYDRALEIQNDIVYAGAGERVQLQLDLAKLYIGNQLYIEALGVLETIDENHLTPRDAQNIILLKAVSHFLFGNYQQAHAHFEEISLENVDEVHREELDFWKAATMVAIRWPRQANLSERFDMIKKRFKFLAEYPDSVWQPLALLDLRGRIEQRELDNATQLLQIMERSKADDRSVNTLHYYQAIILLKQGYEEEGLDILRRLSNDILDRFNRTRATFVLTQYLKHKKVISVSEAIKAIEPLTVTWRGDRLEVDILKYLGELYIYNHHYGDGLRSWKYVVSNLHDSGDVLMIASQMSQVFMDVFTTHHAKLISDFDALALYYEFRELTPVGLRGDEIMIHLAQRLINMDLLDNASGILEYQIKHRLSGEKKEKTINWLAFVHLENNKPGKALQLLEASVKSTAFPEIDRDRHYLYIQSLIHAKQFPKAYSMLIADKSIMGKDLRIECLWKSESWKDLSSFLTMELEEIITSDRPFKKKELSYLMRLMIAQAMLKNKHALVRLNEQIAPRLPENTVHREVLHFLASTNEVLDYHDLTTSLGVEFIEAFLEYYRGELLLDDAQKEKTASLA